jgi:uncharacterized glyoxalase superfamily protein PhnB
MRSSTVIPCITYADAPAAIEWLCSVFGFERHAVHSQDDGGIAHAELKLEAGMIMLGSKRDSDYGNAIREPKQCGGFVTQTIYVITSRPDELYAKARAANAPMVVELRDEPHGSRGFTCRDPEGHLWSFGTYDPWQVA